MIYMFLSINPLLGDINSLNLFCFKFVVKNLAYIGHDVQGHARNQSLYPVL